MGMCASMYVHVGAHTTPTFSELTSDCRNKTMTPKLNNDQLDCMTRSGLFEGWAVQACPLLVEGQGETEPPLVGDFLLQELERGPEQVWRERRNKVNWTQCLPSRASP